MVTISNIKKKLLKSTLFKDSFWALLGNILGKGLALLASVVIARILGKELFGMYGLIRTTLLTIAIFSTFGLGYTATKFIAEYNKVLSNKVKCVVSNVMQITFFSGGIFAVILFIFSKQIAVFIEAEHLYKAIRYLAIVVLLNSVSTTQIAILAGFKKFKSIAKLNLINGIITFISGVIFTYFFNFNGALIALVISQVINCFLFYLEVNKHIDKSNSVPSDTKIKKELLLFSLPVAMQELFYSILQIAMPIFLVKYSNYSEMGLYNAAAQWSSVILFIPGTLRNVILSHFSSNTNDLIRQKSLLNKMLYINFISTFIPFCFIYSFSGLIIKLYGNNFNELKSILNISVFSTIFTCMSGVYIQYSLSLNKVWLTFWIKVVSVILTIITFILVMKYYNDSRAALHLVQINAISAAIFLIVFYVYFNCIFQKRHYENKKVR